MSAVNGERAPLIGEPADLNATQTDMLDKKATHERRKAIGSTAAVFVFIVAIIIVAFVVGDTFPKDPMSAALYVLDRAPVFDGHIDLPILIRAVYANNVTDVDMNGKMPAHVDIPRLRQGKVGGYFWSVFTSCESSAGQDFINATNSVRDTLEQIDVATQMMAEYSDTFAFVHDAAGIQNSMREGKIAGMLGVEGAHQLGNSLAVLRTYANLGVKYVTLTHTCHNAFADSVGFGTYLPPLHGGLSKLGRELIGEMNRLGVLVDLSHTADVTARQALQLSEAPVIWSHSSARAVWNHPRNVPDDILKMIKNLGAKGKDSVVMVNFAPQFVAADGNATVQAVADHVDHIGRVAGRKHVGIGSDFDGIGDTPRGLEDVSKYPQLIAELRKRGWGRRDLAGLTSQNILRVIEGAEDVAKRMQLVEKRKPNYALYNRRPDLPVPRFVQEGDDL